MKKILFITALFFSISAFSQDEKPITKGHLFYGGDFSAEYSKVLAQKHFQLTTSPDIGYFPVNHLAIGLNIPVSYSDSKGGVEYKQLSLGMGPFVKYYLKSGLFFSFKLTGNRYKERDIYTNSNSEITENSLSISPGIGYAYFIQEKAAIELGVHYEYLKTNPKAFFYDPLYPSNKTNNVLVQIGIQLFL